MSVWASVSWSLVFGEDFVLVVVVFRVEQHLSSNFISHHEYVCVRLCLSQHVLLLWTGLWPCALNWPVWAGGQAGRARLWASAPCVYQSAAPRVPTASLTRMSLHHSSCCPSVWTLLYGLIYDYSTFDKHLTTIKKIHSFTGKLNEHKSFLSSCWVNESNRGLLMCQVFVQILHHCSVCFSEWSLSRAELNVSVFTLMFYWREQMANVWDPHLIGQLRFQDKN